MLDPRTLAIALLLGGLALAAKLVDLYRWHIDREPLEDPPPVRIRVNGSRIDEGLPRLRPSK